MTNEQAFTGSTPNSWGLFHLDIYFIIGCYLSLLKPCKNLQEGHQHMTFPPGEKHIGSKLRSEILKL